MAISPDMEIPLQITPTASQPCEHQEINVSGSALQDECCTVQEVERKAVDGRKAGTEEWPTPRTYLKARVSNQACVVAEVRCVMFHHPLCLGLAEMFVRRREAACREHYRRAF